MTSPLAEEFSYRLKVAIRAHGSLKSTSDDEPVRTCVVNGIYISQRASGLTAYIYASSRLPGIYKGVQDFTRVFHETSDGEIDDFWEDAVKLLIDGLRQAQILDDIAGV